MVTIFDPTNPELSDSDIQWECYPPLNAYDDDEECDTVIVYTELEAIEFEKKGYTVFPFERQTPE